MKNMQHFPESIFFWYYLCLILASICTSFGTNTSHNLGISSYCHFKNLLLWKQQIFKTLPPIRKLVVVRTSSELVYKGTSVREVRHAHAGKLLLMCPGPFSCHPRDSAEKLFFFVMPLFSQKTIIQNVKLQYVKVNYIFAESTSQHQA